MTEWIGRELSHYRITKKIGAGGMGELYLAQDSKLDRLIAIKILPSDVSSDEQRLKRLVREAKAMSGITHPNICVIHEVGEVEGYDPFIVMEYIEGETLKEKSQGRTIQSVEIVDIAIQVSDALDAAHAKGVTHRDIKPANIMITPRGQVKVVDFGLATLAHAGDPGQASEQVTQSWLTAPPGTVKGTLPYMSPDQALGHPLDHRTDIFSLGAVLYELATGRLPFMGATINETIDRILHGTPEAISRFNYNVPAELERIIRKCLEKEPDRRYQSSRDLLTDLKNLKRDSVAGLIPAKVNRKSLLLPVSSRSILLALAALAILATSIALFFRRQYANQDSIDSIAVLPFINDSTNPETEYLSDGLTESLINDLSRLSNLKVLARSTVFTFKGQKLNPVQIGRDLKVRAVLTGKLAHRGNTLVIQADLIDSENGLQLWGQRYNRQATDILAVQEEISSEIVSNLRLKFTSEQQQALTKHDTENAEAYRLFLKGRYHWNKYTPEGFEKSIQYFRQAVEVDPTYALAYSGIADSYNILAADGISRPIDVMPKAKAAALKSLELDPSLAQAHVSLGIYLMYYEWDWKGAEREYKKAIELKPNYADIYHFYGHYLEAVGRLEEAISVTKKGVELDPLSLVMNSELAYAYYLMREYDQVIEASKKTLEMDPNFVYASWVMVQALNEKGMHLESLAELNRARSISDWVYLVGAIGYTQARIGQKEEARNALRELHERSSREFVDPPLFVLLYETLGDRGKALEWVKKMSEERSAWIAFHKDPAFDSIRPHPEFRNMLQRAGLL